MARAGQTWSIDLIIGVLIFLVSIGVILTLLMGKQSEDPARLRIESEVVALKLTNDQALGVAQDNQLDIDKLYALADRSTSEYETLKDELGIQDEFCIYLRDENGNLVFIQDPNDDSGENAYAGIGSGSDDVKLSGVPCGKPCKIDQASGTCIVT